MHTISYFVNYFLTFATFCSCERLYLSEFRSFPGPSSLDVVDVFTVDTRHRAAPTISLAQGPISVSSSTSNLGVVTVSNSQNLKNDESDKHKFNGLELALIPSAAMDHLSSAGMFCCTVEMQAIGACRKAGKLGIPEEFDWFSFPVSAMI